MSERAASSGREAAAACAGIPSLSAFDGSDRSTAAHADCAIRPPTRCTDPTLSSGLETTMSPNPDPARSRRPTWTLAFLHGSDERFRDVAGWLPDYTPSPYAASFTDMVVSSTALVEAIPASLRSGYVSWLAIYDIDRSQETVIVPLHRQDERSAPFKDRNAF